MMHTKITQIPYVMHLIIIRLQRQSPPVLGLFSSVKISSPIYFHPKSHQCIQCSSFNRLLQSLTQLCSENPRSHIVVLAKPKLQSMPSRSCRVETAGVVGIWKCCQSDKIRVQRCFYLQIVAIVYVTSNFREAFTLAY